LETVINSISTAINEWINDNQDKLDNAHLTFLSGLAIPLELGKTALPHINIPKIKSITVNGYNFTFETAEITWIEFVLKCFEVGLPNWTIPTFTDFTLKNSSDRSSDCRTLNV